MAADIDQDTYEECVEQFIRAMDASAQEHNGDAETVFNLVNISAGQMFAKPNPVQSAVLEMVLQLNS